jgi:hypothetical protein
MAEIGRIYNISIWALKRHKANHLQEIIDEAAEEIAAQAKDDAVSTLDIANRVIKEKFEEVLRSGNPSYSQLLDWLKFRSEMLGESSGPVKINVEWGPTIQEDGSIVSEPEGISDEEVKEIERFARRQ